MEGNKPNSYAGRTGQRQIFDSRCRSLLTPNGGPNGWTMSEGQEIGNKETAVVCLLAGDADAV